MEESGFFGSNNGDRKYKSELIATFFSKLFTNGVFNNELQVVANDNMSVTLKKGLAFLNGYFYYNPSDKVINISLSDSEQSRIDSVVIRFSKEDRQIITDVIEGLYSSNPIPQELTRNSNVYELRLCNISIKKETDKITSSMIEDCRFDTYQCGQVISAVQQLDTTDIFKQYESYFNEWFENCKNQLSTDAAGNLQLQVNDINTIVNANLDKMLSGWYEIEKEFNLNFSTYDSSVRTGVLNTSEDLTSDLSIGMKVRFKQDSTTKYAFITKISSTQLTLYMGNDYSLENSIVSDFYYSMLKSPNGFPLNRDSWDILKEFSSPSQISNPRNGIYYKLPDVEIAVPIGLWEIGWQGNTYPMRSGSGTNEQQSGLSTSTDSFTHPELNGPNFSNTTQCMLGMFKSHEYNITTKTTFNFVVRTTQTNMTSIGLYSGTTYGYSKLFAKCLYL